MKKLSIIALALAASLMLTACNGGTYERDDDDDDDDDDRSGTHERVDEPDKDEFSDIEPIPVSQIQYSDDATTYWEFGVTIEDVFTDAKEICFPDVIDGEPVAIISEELVYPEGVKTLIFPEKAVIYSKIPASVEVLGLGEHIYPSGIPAENLENIKTLILSDRKNEYYPKDFESYSDSVKIYYKGKQYTKENFPYPEE